MSVKESSGERSVCPSKRLEIPAFSHPFAMCPTPTRLLRWLQRSTNQTVWSGFRTVSRRSTSISALSPPDSICCFTSSKYYVVNLSLLNLLASPLTVRFRGWKKWVTLAGTDTIAIFSDTSFFKTFAVFWPLNTSQISRAFWVGASLNSFLFLST